MAATGSGPIVPLNSTMPVARNSSIVNNPNHVVLTATHDTGSELATAVLPTTTTYSWGTLEGQATYNSLQGRPLHTNVGIVDELANQTATLEDALRGVIEDQSILLPSMEANSISSKMSGFIANGLKS